MSSEFAELCERLRHLSALIRATPFRAAGPIAERACLAVLARKYPDDLRRLTADLDEREGRRGCEG